MPDRSLESCEPEFDEEEPLPKNVTRRQARESIVMLPSVSIVVSPPLNDSGEHEWAAETLGRARKAIKRAVKKLAVSTRRIYVLGVGKGMMPSGLTIVGLSQVKA